MAKIGLDYGHGNNTFPPDKGVRKNSKNYPEYDFNTKLGRKVKSLLKSHGHTIIEGQPLNGRDVPLTTRTNLYNRENVDLVWSIHANAGAPSANGRCSFYWHTSSKSKDLALKYAEEVKKAGYSTHGNGTHASMRGSWTNLHICRETKAPAVLTENGFMTGSKDFDLVFGSKQNQYINDMAQVHVKAIQRWFGETYKGKVKPSKPAPSKPKPSKPQTSTPASGRVESKVNGLRFYNKPSWADKDVVGRVDKGIGFPTIVKKVKVGKGYQYEVKNSKGATYYITAADKYVKVVGGSVPKASKPASKPKPSSKKYPLPNGVYSQKKHGSKKLNAVKQIQRALNAAYFKVGKVDGYYGGKTKDAVSRFQKVHLPYEVDGVYGSNTKKELDKKVN